MNLSTSTQLLSDLAAAAPSSTTWTSPISWTQLLVPAVLAYVALCRALRFRREQSQRRRLGFTDRASLARMTNDEAQQIIRCVAGYEMPAFHQLSLEFGLFKTYGIESISRLLLATGNLTDPDKSARRYEDTALMIAEFMVNPPTSERANKAIARMNFLHSIYRKQGKISNADLLYTLSVFVTEPDRFARLYEWRPLNEMERCAYGVFWRSIGDAMGIDFQEHLERAGTWRDGVEFADDITAWAKAYEIESMRPSAICNKPALALTPLQTYWLPWFAKPFATDVIYVLMGDRVREAFMLPEPSITAAAVVYPLLAMRRFVLRHLAFPRLFEAQYLRDADPKTGMLTTRAPFGNLPYYTKPTLWNRWGPAAWLIWVYGGRVPGDDPLEYDPQGYTLETLGPKNVKGMGRQEMEDDFKRLMGSRRGGCPFG